MNPQFASHRNYGIEPLEARTLLSKTILVDLNAAGPSHDGTSWATAYTDLQTALASAVSGDQIHIADGTYKPTATTDRTISFQMKDGVSVFGGYAGFGAANPDARDTSATPTVLSGDIGIVGTTTDNSYHVIAVTGTDVNTLVDGVVITAGNASTTTTPNNHGGGIYISTGTVALNNCIFNVNSATSSAGAVYVLTASATISNCAFTNNSAGQSGAITYSSSSGTVANCTFTGNSAYANPAGAIFNSSSSPAITSCTFTHNSAQRDGGAIYNSTSASPTITNCKFMGNSSRAGSGGAIYNAIASAAPVITQCAFVGNQATDFGGAVYNNGTSALRSIGNCTFTANHASAGGAIYTFGAATTMVNCIVWGNSAHIGSQFFNEQSGASAVAYSDVQDGWAGTGNINADPVFLDAPSPGADGEWATTDDDFGDIRLSPTSAAIDAGSNSAVPADAATDLAGNARFQNVSTTEDTGSGTAPIVDMGAYEASAALAASAGSPYAVVQGQSIRLDGRGASDIAGPLTYSWDLDANGAFGDAAGANPVFSSEGFSLGMHTIALQVKDSANRTVVSTSTVRVVAPTIYVDSRANAASATGADWEHAFPDLSAALAQAVFGETIRVAVGTYQPASVFDLPSGVSLYGGYAGVGASDPDARDITAYPTILSSGAHVVVADTASTAILDGFTITGGNTGFSSGRYYYGAGLFITGAGTVVRNCIFTNNSAGYNGGGVYTDSPSSSFSNCIFTNNSTSLTSTTNGGGAIYINSSSPTLTDCTFTSNTAYYGAAVLAMGSSPTITNCTFTSNVTHSGTGFSGGGIYDGTGSSPRITNCAFSRNSAFSGGGIADSDANSTILNCIFTANAATMASGGAVSSAGSNSTLTNCIFIGNSGNAGGGAISHDVTSALSITNCTFVANSTPGSGGAIAVSSSSTKIANSIFLANAAGNLGNDITAIGYSPSITYNDVSGYSGTNINANPQFVRNPSPGADGKWGTNDDDYGNLHLQSTSPCIDAGNDASVPAGITTDPDGNPRMIDIPGVHDPGSVVDMGAFERTTPLVVISDALATNAFAPELKLVFSSAIQQSSLSASDITFYGAQTYGGETVSQLNYDPASFTASWTLLTLPDGNYEASIVSNSVLDSAGEGLSTDHQTSFFILSADGDRNRVVDLKDFNILATNFGKTGMTFSQGNYDYSADGKINLLDFNVLATNFGKHIDPPVTQEAVVSAAASSTQTFAVASTSGRRTLRSGVFSDQTEQTNPLDRLNHLDRLDDLATV